MGCEEEAGSAEDGEIAPADCSEVAPGEDEAGDGDRDRGDGHTVGGDGEGIGVGEPDEDGGEGDAEDAQAKPQVEGGRPGGNNRAAGYASSTAMRSRLLMRPLLSWPTMRMRPISLVLATCVPPSACTSRPSISTMRTSAMPSGEG